MRKIIPINNNWYFRQNYEQGMEDSKSLDNFERVNLPHTNIELPYNYFDEKLSQIVSCYKYPLHLSEEYKGKVLYVHFEGVMAYAKVYLNGLPVGEHKGGYTPFDIRLDQAYDWELENNMLTVVADASERSDIPPFGGLIDYLTYGGIYREVNIGVYDDIFIKNIKVETNNVLSENIDMDLAIWLENVNKNCCEAEFIILINEKGGREIYSGSFKTTVDSGRSEFKYNISNLNNVKLWDVDNPNLYEICVLVKTEDSSDEYNDVFGFRKAEFTPEGFFLNGKPLKLIGLNRHQSYPYVGYAMPKRVQEKDAEILKNDLHLNIVRTSHYPQSKHFLNKCDELGLLVFEEIPGWQHIGSSEWKEVAKENVREMIERDWNHPSVILWGVRINESRDDDEFYAATNNIAHALDTTRQTGGVRCITNSNLLEDVYTYNDFFHDGIQKPLREQIEVTGLDHKVPYIVTECNGHMYPTKRFDQEERQMEHALRHVRVHNAAGLDDSISGVIGWCAFDYNTHKDFGSGDRICYHGVMDMFRIHKFAAYAYKSQISPQVEAVLEPVTFWARGERSIGGVLPLVVFTNCDYIEFQYGNYDTKKVFPNKSEYSGVQYPPVIIDFSVIRPEEAGEWGMVWQDATLRGYHNDKVVVERKFCMDPLPSELYVSADDVVLNACEKDATRIVIKIKDRCGNLLPFFDDIIKIEVEGPGKLQGPSQIAVKGGSGGFWVETLNEKGTISILVKSSILGERQIKIDVK